VSLNGASEQSKQASNPDDYYETPDDASEALLKTLYVTLRDDVGGK